VTIKSYINGFPEDIDDVETLYDLRSSYVPADQAQFEVPASPN